MKYSIENQLEEARIIIGGALANPDILNKVSKFGFNQKALQEGNALLGQVEMLISLQNEGFDGQLHATRQLQQARQDTHTTYMRHLGISRFALQANPEYRKLLRLEGPRKKDIPGWLSQVSAFYNNVNRVQAILEQNGVVLSTEEIEQGKAMVAAIADLRLQQLSGKSNKQEATRQRQQAIQELQQWMRDFLYIARYALKDAPQQLEELGQTVS